MYLISVFPTNKSLNVNKPFTYLSKIEIKKYVRVNITFNNKKDIGFVVECIFTEKNVLDLQFELGYTLGYIESIIDEYPIINDELYKLATWMSYNYVTPFIVCLNLMLTKYTKTIKNLSDIKKTSYIYKNTNFDKSVLTQKQQFIFDLIKDKMTLLDLKKLSSSITNKLIQLNAIIVKQELNEFIDNQIIKENFQTLTNDQKKVYDKFLNTSKMISLLYGVTGSGKTEVYLHLAKKYVEDNKQVLILVPEISLTPQMIERVKQRFNDVIFYHSNLTDREKYIQFNRVLKNDVKIIVGTRSSIFLPFKNLGLIICDEEHDQSYKQDKSPYYHTTTIAIKRCTHFNAKLLLASATPSLESYSLALKNDYELLKLQSRINNTKVDVTLLDLNQTIRSKQSTIIPNYTKEEIAKSLNSNEQVLVILNRRGYSPIIKCQDCLETIVCKDCKRSLVYHKNENIYKCHSCNISYKINKCLKCNSSNLSFFGFGTAKVEEYLKILFPNNNIARLDRDIVSKKELREKILYDFSNHKIDILIGTQMISKGLDFPNVTLVVVVNGDAGLMHQDFNSSKLTFDLLMQSSGRSGRKDKPGKTIIQSFNLNHYVFDAVIKQDYNLFYNQEMKYRNILKYPPFSKIVQVLISDINLEKLEKSVSNFIELINKFNVKYLNPIKITNQFKNERYSIIFFDTSTLKLVDILNKTVYKYLERNTSKIFININPLYLE